MHKDVKRPIISLHLRLGRYHDVTGNTEQIFVVGLGINQVLPPQTDARPTRAAP
jgi:hypothetical protein